MSSEGYLEEEFPGRQSYKCRSLLGAFREWQRSQSGRRKNGARMARDEFSEGPSKPL